MPELRHKLRIGVILASLVAAAWGAHTGFYYWLHHGGRTTEDLVALVRKYAPGFMRANQGDPVSQRIMTESVWSAFWLGGICFLVVLLVGLALVRWFLRRRGER